MKKKITLGLFLLVLTTSVVSAQNTFPSTGNVGVGILTPTYLFQVSGGDALINNIRVGHGAGGDSAFSTAIGSGVLESNLSGTFNTGVGYFSLLSNTNGDYNTACGGTALKNNLNGNFNTAFGYEALANNTKGSANTAVGQSALSVNKKGSFNTAVGEDADVSVNDLSNATALGAGALADASNKVRIGNGSILSNGGQVEWTAYSDARIKNDVHENVPGLEFINLLKPVTYHFDIKKQNMLAGVTDTVHWEGQYDIEKIQFTGFLAQDVEAAAKRINYDFSGVDKSGKIMGLRYSEFVVPLVKATQELDAENADLRSTVSSQEREITELKLRVEKLEEAFNTIFYSDTKQAIFSKNTVATLGQNMPNPFNQNTIIPYYVPEASSGEAGNSILATIKISDLNGKEIKSFVIEPGNGIVEMNTEQIPPGNYNYTLIINGKIIDSKQMILTR